MPGSNLSPSSPSGAERATATSIITPTRPRCTTWWPHSGSRGRLAPEGVAGHRFTSGIPVGLLFAAGTVLLMSYSLNKNTTILMVDELARRRQNAAGRAETA